MKLPPIKNDIAFKISKTLYVLTLFVLAAILALADKDGWALFLLLAILIK